MVVRRSFLRDSRLARPATAFVQPEDRAYGSAQQTPEALIRVETAPSAIARYGSSWELQHLAHATLSIIV